MLAVVRRVSRGHARERPHVGEIEGVRQTVLDALASNLLYICLRRGPLILRRYRDRSEMKER